MTLSTEILAPAFVLYENGQKVQDKTLLASIVRIAVDERLDQATVCLVELADSGLALSSGTHFAVGTELKVELGYVGSTDVLFDGEITSWREAFPRRGPPTLVIMGLDRFHRLRRERKTKTYSNMKDADIARQVLGDHQLSVTADATDVAHDYVIQANQSDADFLLARAALNGYELAVDGKTATFRKPKVDDAAAVTLKWHEDLTSFTAVISVASAHAQVQAKAFDMKQKAPVSATVAAGSESSAMGGLKTGNQIFSSGLDATEPTVDPFRPLLSPEEANLLAQATLDRDSKKFVTGEGRIPGNTKVRRGVVVALDGIGEHLSGSYYCSAAIHTLIPRFGFSTVFRVYRTSVLSPKTTPPVQGTPGTPPGQPTPPTGAVEFVVQNQFGDPVDGLDYVLTCPDGEQKTGTIPANGIVREENAKLGVYKLALKGVDVPLIDFDEAKDPDSDAAAAPATPGQWVEVALVRSDGLPVAGQGYVLTLPDGTKSPGSLDANGLLHQDNVTADCTVDFPDLVAADWGASGGTGQSETYTVVQGDCLSSIAKKKGFDSWRTIYDAPENASFKAKRPDPNLIYPGDQIVLPAKGAAGQKVPVGKRTTFTLKTADDGGTRLKLRNGYSCPVHWKLTLDSGNYEGNAEANGIIDVPIEADADSGELLLYLNKDTSSVPRAFKLKIGHLDPLDESSGVQGRLANMGYPVGAVDGELDDDFKAGLRYFQEDQNLTVTGEIDDATKSALGNLDKPGDAPS